MNFAYNEYNIFKATKIIFVKGIYLIGNLDITFIHKQPPIYYSIFL